MDPHFKGVLKVRALEALLAPIRVFYHVVDVVDVALRSILWDLNFQHVAQRDNGNLQDKEKFESMTEPLRASMSTSLENTSTTATNALAKAPGSVIPPHPEPPMPSAPDGTTTMLPASASLDAEPSDRPSMLTSKAKPPARPEEKRPARSTRIPSRQRSTPRRSRGRNPSHSHSSHRRSLLRRRAHSDRHHRGDHGSTSPRSRHHDRPLPRAT